MVIQHPIHYHLPVYRALDEDPDIDLKVLFAQKAWSSSGYEPGVGSVVDWGLSMFEGYAYEIFPNASPWRDGAGFWKFVNPGLIRRVLTGPYDAVYVNGHNYFTHLLAIFAARIGGKRVIFRADSYNLGERTVLVRILRQLIYRVIYKSAHVLLYIGEHNRRFFEDFGGRPRQLVFAPFIVDNARLDAARARLLPRREALKKEFGIAADQKVVLFCAKFMAKKRPMMLVDAFLEADLGDDWMLLMAGDGALRRACEARAAERGAGRIVFTGFLDQNAVSRAYAVADIFVLPSEYQETWGLVVNEAMNFGCPIIASDRVGCAPDLVDGKCGLVFPHDSPEGLVAALRRMAEDDGLRSRYGERARAVIAAWSVDEYMAGLRRALGLSSRIRSP